MYSVKKMQRCGKQKIEEIFVDVGRDELSLRKRPRASRCCTNMQQNSACKLRFLSNEIPKKFSPFLFVLLGAHDVIYYVVHHILLHIHHISL